MQNIHEVPERRQQNTRLMGAKGGTRLALYGLLGGWAMRVIAEFPDAESALRALVNGGQSGLAHHTDDAHHLGGSVCHLGEKRLKSRALSSSP